MRHRDLRSACELRHRRLPAVAQLVRESPTEPIRPRLRRYPPHVVYDGPRTAADR